MQEFRLRFHLIVFLPKGPTTRIPALLQIVTWRRPGAKSLSEPMMASLPTHVCVIIISEIVNKWCLSVGEIFLLEILYYIWSKFVENNGPCFLSERVFNAFMIYVYFFITPFISIHLDMMSLWFGFFVVFLSSVRNIFIYLCADGWFIFVNVLMVCIYVIHAPYQLNQADKESCTIRISLWLMILHTVMIRFRNNTSEVTLKDVDKTDRC